MWPLPVNWAYVHAYGQTQDWDLSAQLAAGVRFLDLRVKGDGWLYHGPLACALTLEAALQTCHSFLQEHRSELLLLRIKDEERSRDSAHRVCELVKKFAKYMPLHFSRQSCLVCDLRGKMLVLQDWQGPEVSLPWGNSTMKIQDFWNPGSLKEKWVAVLKHLRGVPRRQGEQLCANFLSAQSFPRRTPRYFAGILNTRFCASVSRRRYSALGIVVMDFPTQELINQIIRTNFIQAQVPATRVLQTLESGCRQYASTLRDIDRAAEAKPPGSAEEYVEKLSAVYARLLVQRSQFAIVSDEIRAECSLRKQVPSDLQLTAEQISWIWQRNLFHTRQKVDEVAKAHEVSARTPKTRHRQSASRTRRGTVQLFQGNTSSGESPVPAAQLTAFL